MFGRRKSNDGFEWHKYVRTTIKLKREERRQRVLEARRVAAQRAGEAGVALAAGSRAAGAAALGGARVGLGVAGLAAQALWNLAATGAAIAWHTLSTVAAILWHKLAILLQPLIAALARPNIGGPAALIGAIALALGLGRYSGAGADREATIAVLVGVVLLVAALPLLSSLTGVRMPRLSALGISPRAALAGVAAVAIVAIGAWMANGGTTHLASLSSQLPLVGSSKVLEGRAEAVGGDLVRIAGTTVRLAGIEAPERQQTCGAGSRRTRCGAAAQAALGKLVNGHTVACTVSGTDSAGRSLASCTRGGLDINGELVRQGHAFAGSSLFASYSSLARQARDAKAGLWAAGDVERPSEFRAKAWDEAKRRAPDGCPIKGLVTGGERVYVLPGSPDYDRGRIQKARGERWFCSEREAEAAGFKPAVRG
jgi:endonuclease YncB( thermonuclease family)